MPAALISLIALLPARFTHELTVGVQRCLHAATAAAAIACVRVWLAGLTQ
jgi:hypothetical protein